MGEKHLENTQMRVSIKCVRTDLFWCLDGLGRKLVVTFYESCSDRLDSCPDGTSRKSWTLRVSELVLQRVPSCESSCACLDRVLMCPDRLRFKPRMSSF
jgi:hypothetical protein